MSEDYVVRYGNQNGVIDRTFYTTYKQALKQFNKFKQDSDITWAELLYEPLNEDVQQVVDSFEKQVVNVLGVDVVINL